MVEDRTPAAQRACVFRFLGESASRSSYAILQKTAGIARWLTQGVEISSLRHATEPRRTREVFHGGRRHLHAVGELRRRQGRSCALRRGATDIQFAAGALTPAIAW